MTFLTDDIIQLTSKEFQTKWANLDLKPLATMEFHPHTSLKVKNLTSWSVQYSSTTNQRDNKIGSFLSFHWHTRTTQKDMVQEKARPALCYLNNYASPQL